MESIGSIQDHLNNTYKKIGPLNVKIRNPSKAARIYNIYN